jgi:hypothetical protein
MERYGARFPSSPLRRTVDDSTATAVPGGAPNTRDTRRVFGLCCKPVRDRSIATGKLPPDLLRELLAAGPPLPELTRVYSRADIGSMARGGRWAPGAAIPGEGKAETYLPRAAIGSA